jgi:hypothetical protein
MLVATKNPSLKSAGYRFDRTLSSKCSRRKRCTALLVRAVAPTTLLQLGWFHCNVIAEVTVPQVNAEPTVPRLDNGHHTATLSGCNGLATVSYEPSGFMCCCGNSWVAERLAVSQQGLCCISVSFVLHSSFKQAPFTDDKLYPHYSYIA